MELRYADYLGLPTLLSLQQPRSEPVEHDEMLFIVIHQVFELWFKQILHELERVLPAFSQGDVFGALGTLKRVRMILKTVVGQLDVLETMTPLSFVAFRDRLDTASGFQSVQFRELEFLLGYKRQEMLRYLPPSAADRARLEQRLAARTLIDHFYDLLGLRGLAIPAVLRDRDVRESNQPNEEIQLGLLGLYREQPEMALLFELMMDIDEGLQEWRYRHVKIAERTIGNKRGTGGSLGVEFLKQSLFRPIFPDLWAIRHQM